MPEQFCHIRTSIKRVKPEFYSAFDKLISSNQLKESDSFCYHNSYQRIFGRQWKHHDEDSNSIDVDTTPSNKSIRETGRVIATYTMKCIVDEIIASDDTVITYHDGGSKKNGVGSFMVQGVTINGKFRAFPTLLLLL